MVFRQGQGNENVEDRMRMVIDLLSVYLHSLTCETTCHEYSKFEIYLWQHFWIKICISKLFDLFILRPFIKQCA